MRGFVRGDGNEVNLLSIVPGSAVAAGLLRVVKGEVGPFDQLLPMFAGRVSGQAAANGNLHGLAVKRELRPIDPIADVGGDFDGLIEADAREDRRKLIAPKPRQHGPDGKHVADQLREFEQHGIADLVAERIVNGLKMVDIEDDDGKGAKIVFGGKATLIELVIELSAVRQPSNGVGLRFEGRGFETKSLFVIERFEACESFVKFGGPEFDAAEDLKTSFPPAGSTPFRFETWLGRDGKPLPSDLEEDRFKGTGELLDARIVTVAQCVREARKARRDGHGNRLGYSTSARATRT